MGILVLDAAADPGQQEHSRAEGSQVLWVSTGCRGRHQEFLGAAQHLRKLRFVFGNEPLIHSYWKATDQMSFPNISKRSPSNMILFTIVDDSFLLECTNKQQWRATMMIILVEGRCVSLTDQPALRLTTGLFRSECWCGWYPRQGVSWFIILVIPTKRCSMLYNGVWITSCHLSHRVWYNLEPWPSLATV